MPEAAPNNLTSGRLLALYWLLGTFGIEGAAVARVLRVAVETLVLFAMARRFLPADTLAVRRAALIIGTALLTLTLPLCR